MTDFHPADHYHSMSCVCFMCLAIDHHYGPGTIGSTTNQVRLRAYDNEIIELVCRKSPATPAKASPPTPGVAGSNSQLGATRRVGCPVPATAAAPAGASSLKSWTLSPRHVKGPGGMPWVSAARPAPRRRHEPQ